MEITCDIAMDLVDVYTSRAASEDTEAAVRDHLKSCKECRRFYDGYKKSLDEEKKKKQTCFKVETSPCAADELIADSMTKVSKRLRRRRILSIVCSCISIAIVLASAVIDLRSILSDSD